MNPPRMRTVMALAAGALASLWAAGAAAQAPVSEVQVQWDLTPRRDARRRMLVTDVTLVLAGDVTQRFSIARGVPGTCAAVEGAGAVARAAPLELPIRCRRGRWIYYGLVPSAAGGRVNVELLVPPPRARAPRGAPPPRPRRRVMTHFNGRGSVRLVPHAAGLVCQSLPSEPAAPPP